MCSKSCIWQLHLRNATWLSGDRGTEWVKSCFISSHWLSLRTSIGWHVCVWSSFCRGSSANILLTSRRSSLMLLWVSPFGKCQKQSIEWELKMKWACSASTFFVYVWKAADVLPLVRSCFRECWHYFSKFSTCTIPPLTSGSVFQLHRGLSIVECASVLLPVLVSSLTLLQTLLLTFACSCLGGSSRGIGQGWKSGQVAAGEGT